jgi:hypothetical protein
VKAQDRLGGALGLRARALHRRRVYAALAVAAAAALVAIVSRPIAPPTEEFQARGSPSAPLAVEAYRVAPHGEPQPLGEVLHTNDELAFAYNNATGAKYLFIVGVDEHGHVYWYHPAWLDPAESPTAVPIAPGRHELPEAVSHSLDGSELTLYGVFSDGPLNVRQVERKIADNPGWLREAAGWSRRLRIVD